MVFIRSLRSSFYYDLLASSFFGMMITSLLSKNSFEGGLRSNLVLIVFTFILGRFVAAWCFERVPRIPLEHFTAWTCVVSLLVLHRPGIWFLLPVLSYVMIQFFGTRGIERFGGRKNPAALWLQRAAGLALGFVISLLPGRAPLFAVALATLIPYFRFTFSHYSKTRAESHHPWVGFIVIAKLFLKQKNPPKQSIMVPQISASRISEDGLSDSSRVRLLFGGDYAPEGKSRLFSSELREWILSHDFRFFNLEGPIWSEKGRAEPYLLFDVSVENITQTLRSNGRENLFNVISLVNNHSYDRGMQGRKKTVNLLGEMGVQMITEKFSVLPIRDGLRIGVVGRVFGTNSIFLGSSGVMNPELLLQSRRIRMKVESEIRNFKDHCDFLILSYHWGFEAESVPAQEQKECWRILSDMGVDLLYGHHSHLPQEFALDAERAKLCLYSCGNLDLPIPNPLYDNNLLFSVELLVNHGKGSQPGFRIGTVDVRAI